MSPNTLKELIKIKINIPNKSITTNVYNAGYIMRPHRRSMTDVTAEGLFFCKENIIYV